MRGFSLVEFVIAIGLLAMILSLGYVVSFQYLGTQHLREVAETVNSELTRTRAYAFAQTNDANHGVKVFEDHLVRFEGASYAARVQSQDLITPFPVTVTLSGGSEVVWARGTSSPTSATTITLERDTLAIDIIVSSYGLVTITERTISN